MKVKRLTMQSFRGISDLTLEFDENEPTVLIGINGVGKSSVLDCIAILLSQFIEQIQDSLESLRFFTTQDIENGHNTTCNEITVSIELQEFTWSMSKAKDTKNLDDQKSDLANLKEILDLEKEIINSLGNYKDLDTLKRRVVNLRTKI
ncbi:AAA family ATPase [Amazonocrinis nigriterrae]|nr:AAA family ATPase [Amazonocrinis nigriterrae]